MPPPITTSTDPPVTAIAFAEISERGSISNGKPADNPARINLFIPKAISTKIVNSSPVLPLKISKETIDKFIARAILEKKSARCLETRSKIVPTKGPTTE
ncbi:unannotated protein [freshwater metagenome]|uniref:Unannotated protein n=1 Tax=freshwater metagenome TaxID=449393 RepID=A0A6J6MC40_9ZZZZ